jgi:hypothetical protein
MRLGETSENVHMDENHDPALEDEQMTEQVMNMMKNIPSERDEDDEDDQDMFDRIVNRQATTHSQIPFAAASQQEEEEEDELLKNLLTV